MFQKIFDALKAKHSNIPKSVLERVAKLLSKTCTEEDKISEAVEGAGEMVSEIADLVQKEGDRRATEASKKNPGQQQNPTQDPPKPESGEDVPAWAKALIESNKQVTEKLQSLEAEKTSQNFSQKAIAFAKEKGIPEKFANTLLKVKGLIKSEEEFNDFTTLLENDFKEIQPEFTPANGAPPPPVFGTSTKSGVSSMVENFIKEDEKNDPFAGKKI